MSCLLALGMFALIFASDFVWTWWTKACAKGRVLQASIASVIIYASGGVTMIGYVEHPWLIVPACVGAFCGTACAMKWVKHD